MSAVASEAGVATGTAYVHYESKDELILAAYLESKRRLAEAATAKVKPDQDPERRFRALWLAAYRYLAGDPLEARFLIQVDGSPYAQRAHAAALAGDDDPLQRAASTEDMAETLLRLPPEVLYELGMAPAVHLAARGTQLSRIQLETVAAACWRAISRPS